MSKTMDPAVLPRQVRRYCIVCDRMYQLLPTVGSSGMYWKWILRSHDQVRLELGLDLYEQIPKFQTEEAGELYKQRAAKLEQEAKTGREATTRTTMGTKNKELEKLTKAQLIERLQSEMHRVNVLESEKEKIKEEYNASASSHADTMGRLTTALSDLDNVQGALRAADLAKERLSDELKEALQDRNNWREAHGKLDERYGKMRRLFIRQSHLAGELAKETGNVDLNVTW